MKKDFYYIDKAILARRDRAFDKVYRDLHCITRSNDRSKIISENALLLLTNLASLIVKSSKEEICVNYDFLCSITGRGRRQNVNLLRQLSDILDYQYFPSKCFEGEKYRNCCTIKFTEDGELRINHPELFYTIDSKLNLVKKRKELRSVKNSVEGRDKV
jgi:hypothetical protein